jgi:hypothetical protein
MPQPVIESKEYWEQQLERLKASGLPRTQYCRENGVNYDRFGYWITKLRVGHSTFLPIKMQSSESNTCDTALLCTLELRGHVIKIHDLTALSCILDRIS